MRQKKYNTTMAIAISETNLQEIYNLNTEEKLDLVNLIIKSIRSAAFKINAKSAVSKTSWAERFNGKWIDSKSAEEMVNDLRRSRTNNAEVIL